MRNVSEQLIKDLIDQGVDTFFGIQGGACARLIENVIKFGGKYFPVLNEQSAGFYAHGYYMATNKTAGLIFTTGPGLTNGLSGIAACYYDRVPLVTLVGQVVTKLNIAKNTKTRMVGFQEVPHLDLCKPISDNCFKIDTKVKYFKFRDEFLKNLTSKVQVIEFLDDIQRVALTKKVKKYKKLLVNNKTFLSKKNIELIKKSKKPIIILGSGFAQTKNFLKLLKIIKDLNIKISCTWGGQKIQKFLSKKDNFIGLMGNHNPGLANREIKKSDLVISLGCSLLQHQVGKDYSNFAPDAKIIYINNDLNECKRAQIQFGKRLRMINLDIKDFLNHIKKLKKNRINTSSGVDINKSNYPVNFLKSVLKSVDKNSIIFADAGATLSWTYQAANNLEKCPSIFTSFNLHSMGYANCASIGAAISKKKNVFCIIGDGSIPMNSQEFAWLKKYPIKLIILDNNGYGIIRQTQRDFYKSKFYGSDFLNKKSSLPNFSIEKILKSHDIKFKKITKNKIKNYELNWLNSSGAAKALIVKVKYEASVSTE
jgi:acetolactate synthase I/II/III large subunit